MIEFQRGQRYRITFHPGGQKKTATVEANYLGEDYSGLPTFDLRPMAGTSTIDPENIVEATHIGPGVYERS